MESLQELFMHFLKDIYYAEKQILKALPKMIKKADNRQLEKALENHLGETEGQVERLEQIFDILGEKAKAVKCPAILGILEEGTEIMKESEDDQVMNAGIIAANQAVEHYEIARYGTLLAWAQQMGLKKVIPLLEQTLEEEKNADKLLSKLAVEKINLKAAA